MGQKLFTTKVKADDHIKHLISEGVGEKKDFYVEEHTMYGGHQKFYTVEENTHKKALKEIFSTSLEAKIITAKIQTYWGEAQTSKEIEDGVVWYTTAGHGGLGVASNVAKRKLSKQALEQGTLWKNAYWYEEDCLYAIPFYEHPEWAKKLGGLQSKDQYEKEIIRWCPEYFKKAKTASKFTQGFEKFFNLGYEGAIALEGLLHKYNVGLSDLGLSVKQDALNLAKREILTGSGSKYNIHTVEQGILKNMESGSYGGQGGRPDRFK